MRYQPHTCFVVAPALGNGSARNGGAPSQADGGRVAFGNTEESLIRDVLGVAERGCADDGALNRSTGAGWVRATTNHQYADAQRRGNPTTLFVSETTSAVSDTLRDTLRALDRESRLPTSMDSTVYGVARSSPQRFYAHHLAAHSSAVTFADVVTLHMYATELQFKLSAGIAS